MSPEKSDGKNLLVSPRGDFYILYFFSQFSLDWSRRPFIFMKLIDSSKSKVQGFILIYKKNACFLQKIIWFLFHSIAEGLALIMQNNIIDMASRVTFAGPLSFDEIFHNIFAHLELYFVNNDRNLLFEFLNWLRSINMNLVSP